MVGHVSSRSEFLVHSVSLSRSSLRSAGLALIAERGLSAVSIDDIARHVDCSPAEVLAEFPTAQDVVTTNDFFDAKVEYFRGSDPQLSCSRAWLVALDERAAEISAEEWAIEAERQRLFGVESANIDNLLAGLAQATAALAEAVIVRTGADAGSPGVRAFAGTIIGLQFVMPSGAFPDAPSWTAAHAAVLDAIGPGLDRLLH
jgi:AcrR family transcriptional regulator